MVCVRESIRRFGGLQCMSLVLLACIGCSGNPVPLGPDLVACECQCVTQSPVGLPTGPNDCGGLCDPPCPSGLVCGALGGCFPSCTPSLPPNFIFRQSETALHVCVDATNVSLASRACSDRCDGYASGSVLQCLNGLLVALGVEKAGGDTIPLNITDKINPNAAQSLASLIVDECGTWLFDAVTDTCGLETQGTKALVDLLFCIWSPASGIKDIQAVRTCNLIPDRTTGAPFTVQQVNGCPEFAPTGGGAGTPVGGQPLPASAAVVTSASLVSISGGDVTTASSNPSGTASTGRIGPILVISQLRATLPDAHLNVKGHDVALSGGFLELEGPAGAVLADGTSFAVLPGKLKFIATGSVAGRMTSVEATNATSVTGHYDEARGVFDLAGSIDLQGLDAAVQLKLTLNFVNRPPRANAGPDQIVECTLPTREGVVQLSAAQSVDPDPGDRIANYVWKVGNQLVGEGSGASQVSAHLGLGTRLATLTTVDTRGSASRATSLITVVDSKPPVFDVVRVDPDCLWPPNHKMVLFRLGQEIHVETHDGCDRSPSVFIKSVESSQPSSGGGSGGAAPDFVHGTAAVCLRAERAGHAREPRVYKITLAATDFSGNEADQVVEVTVPHDQGHGKCPALPRSLIVADDDPACAANVPQTPTTAAVSSNR